MKKHEIEKLRTERGGFTKADLERYGVPWPPPKGWLKKLKRGQDLPPPPPVAEGSLYTHNSRKPNSAYHLATSRGTMCKMEHSPFIKYQDTVTDIPPHGKRLCSMCAGVTTRKESDAGIPWDERYELF